jgi:hypothetical protein
MAIFKIFPEKDATIYSYYPAKNSGIDEILEISIYDNVIDNRGEVARSLIKFPQQDILNIFNTKVSGSSYSASLKLYLADATQIPLDYTLFCHPVSMSWNMGTGRAANLPTSSDGVSWTYAKHNEVTQSWATSSFTSGVTASYQSYAIGGGNWFTGSYETTQSFGFHSNKDIEFNVTNIVKSWYSSSIANEGFIIKHSSSLEWQYNTVFELKYFGTETHTIYTPVLEIKWNDFTYATSSLGVVSSDDVVLTTRLSGELQEDTTKRVRVYARDRFPTKTFVTSSIYTTNKYLPTASYWAIKDVDSEEFIVDFDTSFTKLSADSTSNYFTLHTDGLFPERWYKILIKTTVSGSTTVVDNNNLFKVTR